MEMRTGYALVLAGALCLIFALSCAWPARAEPAENIPVFEIPPRFVKYAGNPIMGPRGIGWESRRVYNPSVIVENGVFHMLYRAEGGDGISGRIGYAWSEDGLNFTRLPDPVLSPSESYDIGGCEDPRVVRIGGRYYMTYTGNDPLEGGGYRTPGNICLARSGDLIHWEKLGETVQPAHAWNSYQIKAGALVPERIGGYYYMFYMGENQPWRGRIGLARATDIDNVLTWEDFLDRPILEPRSGNYFDSVGVEPGAVYMLGDRILLIYNGWCQDPSGQPGTYVHRTGWAIFSRDFQLLARCEEPIIDEYVPGTSNMIAFSESICFKDGMWYIHYGIQDRWIGVAVYDTRPVETDKWWNTAWRHRRAVSVGNHPENYQIMVPIPPEIPKSAYPSIRFLEDSSSDPLPYWIERDESEYLSIAWVRRLDNRDRTIWMYYGNPAASSAENGDNVFLFFDDFGGGTGGQDALNRIKWGASTTGVDVFEYVLRLEDYNNQDGFIEHIERWTKMQRSIEFRMKNARTWRGGITLAGPGGFGNKREYAEVFRHDDGTLRFFSDGEWSPPGLVLPDSWYLVRVDLFESDKIQARFYWGMPGTDFGELLWVSGEKTNNWNPQAGESHCDRYRLHVWDGGGDSSYYYDWIFVRRLSRPDPIVVVQGEETLPGKPVLLSPENGTTVETKTPVLRWGISQDAEAHRVILDNDPDLCSPLIEITVGGTVHTYQIPAGSPLANGTYYWRVIGVRGNLENPSDVWMFTVWVGEARFRVENLRISPWRVKAGEAATVSVDVTNSGEVAGTLTLSLTVDSAVREARDVSLEPGETETVSFTVVENELGVHQIEVAGLTGVLIVELPSGQPDVRIVRMWILPGRVDPGENVEIQVETVNLGTALGTCEVRLKVRGTVVGWENFPLGPGESRILTFTVRARVAGPNPVEADGLRACLWVIDSREKSGGKVGELAVLQAGTAVEVDIGTPTVLKLSFRPARSAENETIEILEFERCPENVRRAPGIVRSYISISLLRLSEGDIENVVIWFRVERSWIRRAGLNGSSIALYRYNWEKERWEKIATERIGGTDEFVYFAARSGGLSLFAISAGPSGLGWPVIVACAAACLVALLIVRTFARRRARAGRKASFKRPSARRPAR